MTEEAVSAVRKATEVRDHVVPQLRGTDRGLDTASDAADRLIANLNAERPWRHAGELTTDAQTLRELYVETRKQVLARQYERAEAARGRIKQRQGFSTLSADLAETVLRPIQEALPATTPEAVAPALADLGARFEVDLVRAEAQANDLLDEALAHSEETQVVKVDTRVRGREIQSRKHLREVFQEIEERVGPMLDQGKRVRLL